MSEATTLPDDIAAMSFEDALAELEGIVRRLEGGQVKLDDAIQSYERGAQLKRHCEKKLNEAQQRVDRIVVAPDGAVTVEPAKLDLRGGEAYLDREPVARLGHRRRGGGGDGATDRFRPRRIAESSARARSARL